MSNADIENIKSAIERDDSTETSFGWLISVSGNTKLNWGSENPKGFGKTEFENAWITVKGETHELPAFVKKILKKEFGEMSMGELLREMERGS